MTRDEIRIPAPRCQLCGKFRKPKDVVEIDYSDNYTSDSQLECIDCVSQVDRERYFKDRGDDGRHP